MWSSFFHQHWTLFGYKFVPLLLTETRLLSTFGFGETKLKQKLLTKALGIFWGRLSKRTQSIRKPIMPNSPSKMKQIIHVQSINKTIRNKQDSDLVYRSNTFYCKYLVYQSNTILLVTLPIGSFMQCTEEVLLASLAILSTFTSTQYTCNGCSEVNDSSPSSSSSSSLLVSVCV